jgi:hypothetical protein
MSTSSGIEHKMAKIRKPTLQTDIISVLHIIAVSSPQPTGDFIDTVIDEIERLRQIESHTLELLSEMASKTAPTLDHPTCKAIMELTIDR